MQKYIFMAGCPVYHLYDRGDSISWCGKVHRHNPKRIIRTTDVPAPLGKRLCKDCAKVRDRQTNGCETGDIVKPTFGSLFTGIGGLDLGLERAGWQCEWQVEIGEYERKVLERHWPTVRRFRDVLDCGASNLKSVDLICGGFPCQPISKAGKRKGENDARWLWPEFHRIICALRPRHVLVENVAALLVRGMGTILRDLATSGYGAEWQVLSAAAFGAPHLRRRVFIVAYPNGEHGNGPRMVFHGQHAEAIRAEGDKNRIGFWASSNTPAFRVAHGSARRMDKDRGRGLGNTVVPQLAQWIGRAILEHHRTPTDSRGASDYEYPR